MTDQLQVSGIRGLEDMIGPAEQRHEAGGLIEHVAEALRLGFELPVRKDLLCCLAANDQDAPNTARGLLIINRTVAVGPVDVLFHAIAGDRNEVVFMPGGTSTRHNLVNLR